MADCKKYGRTANLFDYVSYFDSVFTPYNEFFNYAEIQLQPNTTYTLSTSIMEYGTSPRNTPFIVTTTNQTPTTAVGGLSNISPVTITTENDGILKLYKRILGSGIQPTKDLFDDGEWLMLNTGSTALPYQPYLDWQHSLKKFDGTDWIDATVKEDDGTNWQ